MIDPRDVTAVVLCGGKSTRMGRDKATLEIAGRPMAEWVIDTARALFPRVVVSTNNPQLHARFGCECVADLEPGWGALAGIHAGFEAAHTPWVFVIACDTPAADPRMIRWLLSRAASDEVTAVLPHSHGFHQPLHAAYGPRTLSLLRARRGQPFHLHSLLSDPGVVRVSEDEVAASGLGIESFLQANTPEELAALEELLRHRRTGS